ncbi:TPA: hypothetical protein P7K80_001932 [Vibrio cholerae]|uniref:Toxin co-regulated pilus biosynthesis protein Q C-terminal domain-containing protein n=1 Tax=Vibrio cholerae TaxID=666 RepID=A0ABD7ST53_VIBCL|nr:hypothetical protein [Vibrio cholerae]HAS6017049.1 hypothetical protein [Vibrio cholerae O1]EGQ9333595.1 hypothetical protein [Vibrio cholerae]EGR1049123.1 hypothetical protein [Vibrio cholerae]EGR3963818.1 hypothetical protein [Vibrio cholerae]EGR4347834.1 hypothetical protein [Vibrio cholerae]
MKKTLLVLMLSALSGTAIAEKLPTLDPLDTTVRTVFPNQITTAGEAVKWLVEPLGYYVVTDYPAPATASQLLSQPLPDKAKIHRTMPVLHAVQLIIGEDNTIIVDKTNLLMTFSRGH